MKVNRELNEVIRYHKELCETSEIECIYTDEFTDDYCSDFSIKAFKYNASLKVKKSVWIVSFKETYNVIYYSNFKKIEIKLFPSCIKRIVYKVEQPTI